MISGSGLEGALEELMGRLLIPAGPKVMEWRHAVESRRERIREASDGHSQSSLENSVPGVGSGCGVGVRGGLRTPKYGPNDVRLVVMATHIYFDPGVHVRF